MPTTTWAFSERQRQLMAAEKEMIRLRSELQDKYPTGYWVMDEFIIPLTDEEYALVEEI